MLTTISDVLLAMLLPTSTDIRIDAVTIDTHRKRLTLNLTSTQITPLCPRCRQPSTRAHSTYARMLADLPWADVTVDIHIQVRTWFCETSVCPQSIFTERIPALARPWARRTTRLATTQAQIGFALGGAAGSRLSTTLRMDTGRDTLLELVRRTPVVNPQQLQAVGIDDWARRKGHTYGTIIVDLETGRAVDVLPDRSSESVAVWLAALPQIQVIRRDRAVVYADGATHGAPQATQVADRWHILKNLGDAVLRTFQMHHTTITKALTEPVVMQPSVAEQDIVPVGSEHVPLKAMVVQPHLPQTQSERERHERATHRQARHSTIHRLDQDGWTLSAIASHLHLDRKTVRKYLRTTDCPQPQRRIRRASVLDPYKSYLLERWHVGCSNAAQRLREIQAQGFRGKRTTVRAFLTPLRQAQDVPAWARHGGKGRTGYTQPPRPPTARTLTWYVLARPTALDDDKRTCIERVRSAHPDLDTLITRAQEFAVIVRERLSEQLDGWLENAAKSALPILQGFASSLRQDYNAVFAALSLPWSNGATEGNVNRLKMLKRQMYGRAKVDLLRQRVLAR